MPKPAVLANMRRFWSHVVAEVGEWDASRDAWVTTASVRVIAEIAELRSPSSAQSRVKKAEEFGLAWRDGGLLCVAAEAVGLTDVSSRRTPLLPEPDDRSGDYPDRSNLDALVALSALWSELVAASDPQADRLSGIIAVACDALTINQLAARQRGRSGARFRAVTNTIQSEPQSQTQTGVASVGGERDRATRDIARSSRTARSRDETKALLAPLVDVVSNISASEHGTLKAMTHFDVLHNRLAAHSDELVKVAVQEICTQLLCGKDIRSPFGILSRHAADGTEWFADGYQRAASEAPQQATAVDMVVDDASTTGGYEPWRAPDPDRVAPDTLKSMMASMNALVGRRSAG